MGRLIAKHWAIALVISLAVNALLAGVLVARWARGPHAGPVDLFPRPLHGLRRQLDPATHPAIDRIDAAHAARLEERMRAVSDARATAMAELSAADFDEQAAKVALAEFRIKAGEAQDELHEALIELAKAITPEQRRSLGDAWGRAGYRRGPPAGARGGPGHGRGHRRGAGRGGPWGAPGEGPDGAHARPSASVVPPSSGLPPSPPAGAAGSSSAAAHPGLPASSE